MLLESRIVTTSLESRLRQTENVIFPFIFFLKKNYTNENSAIIIVTFDAKGKLLNILDKLKTTSGKYRVNMVTWPFLQFAVNAILNLSNLYIKFL